MDGKEKPIGVFDSGIGGLTVLRELINFLPYEDTIYLGDTARVPYGIRSAETVIRYSLENAIFLYSKGIKLLVIACNTASSVSLDVLKKEITIPIIGVIEPGAKEAVKATKKQRIGVIGTEATIQSNSYAKAIKGIDPRIEVFSLPCPLFVPLVEEGWTDGEIAYSVAKKYLEYLKDKDIDTLVLGCTHYPLLKGVISNVMGEGVTLIDSAIETSREVKTLLEKLGLKRENNINPKREFFVTDSPERFLKVGENFLKEKIKSIKKIQLGS